MSRPVLVAALDETAVLVKTGAVKLCSVSFFNNAAAGTFIQCFNAAAAADVTVGTTVPDTVFAAAAAGDAEQSGLEMMFGKGLVVAATTTATGNTGPSAAVNVGFGLADG